MAKAGFNVLLLYYLLCVLWLVTVARPGHPGIRSPKLGQSVLLVGIERALEVKKLLGFRDSVGPCYIFFIM